MRVRAHRYTERPCQPKVRKLKVIILVDKQVLGLQISMENTMGMAIEETSCELVQETLNKRACQYHRIRRVRSRDLTR